MNIVIIGLSITSSWGNGHATTFRGLVKSLEKRGHETLFLERDTPWYSQNRDMPVPPYGRTELYTSLTDIKDRFQAEVESADVVMVGSYVPEGIEVGQWVTKVAKGLKAFYDIDTPITLRAIGCGECQYLSAELIASYDLYLSFAGGSSLQILEQRYKSPCARAFYCSVDPDVYYPEDKVPSVDLGYLGTYSEDRQPPLNRLLFDSARQWREGRFLLAGSQYPDEISWPYNLQHIEHLPPALHRGFYNSQRFTLNITRADMIEAGYSPSVRLFEAAACATPVISDYWNGIETLLVPGVEILISTSTAETLSYLHDIPEQQRCRIAELARARILAEHTADHRAVELEEYVKGIAKRQAEMVS